MIYRHTTINMSRSKLSDMLYWCLIFEVSISTHFTMAKKYTRKQNAYNGADFVLGFKSEEDIARFEEETGFILRLPPKMAF